MERAQALACSSARKTSGHPAIVCTTRTVTTVPGISTSTSSSAACASAPWNGSLYGQACDWEAGKKHAAPLPCSGTSCRCHGDVRASRSESDQSAGSQGDYVSEREYWAQRRGQRRLDHANAKLAAEGQQPTQTVYQTELDKLRKQIYAVLNKTTTFEEFSALLMQETASP